MAGRRFATFGGLAAVGAGTYYLYSAGGNPKLAEKKMERMFLYSTHAIEIQADRRRRCCKHHTKGSW